MVSRAKLFRAAQHSLLRAIKLSLTNLGLSRVNANIWDARDQFYPQELQLFHYVDEGPRADTVRLANVQVKKARHRVPKQKVLLETTYLYPLVTAPEIKPFKYNYDGLLVAFPYDAATPTKPIEPTELGEKSPLLLGYYEKHRDMIESLSQFNAKIRGPNPGAFYGLARTGPYSFADVYVAFRKDTQWCAAVVSSQSVPWGGEKRFVFQSHAVSVCERQSGSHITENEAHYVCAILNAPLVVRFIAGTSDNRSFKVRPPIFVPLFDPDDDRHLELARLSREAHTHPESISKVLEAIERIYLTLCGDETFDAMIAKDRLDDIEAGKVKLIYRRRTEKWFSLPRHLARLRIADRYASLRQPRQHRTEEGVVTVHAHNYGCRAVGLDG